MSTRYAAPTIPGTTIKKVLNFLKQTKATRPVSFEALTLVCVQDGYWYTTNTHLQARVCAPIDIPNGLYNLFDALPVLGSSPAVVTEEPNGIIINGLVIPRKGNPDRFPSMPVDLETSNDYGPVPALWNTVTKFTAEDEVRIGLNGVLLSPTGRLVATNGSRLITVAWNALWDLPRPIISFVYTPKTPATLSIDFQHNFLHFIQAEGIITTRSLDEHYPEYDRVIPDPQEAHWQGYCDGKTIREWATPIVKLAPRKGTMCLNLKTGEAKNPMIRVTPFDELMEKSSPAESESLLMDPRLFNFLSKDTDPLKLTWTTYGTQAPMMAHNADVTILILPLRPPV